MDQMKEDTSVSIHPVPSHDSEPLEDAKDSNEREENNPEPTPTLQSPKN